MEHISQLLLYQRLRNRIIELLELHSSFEDIAMLGAFEAVNLVYDWLPLDYEKSSQSVQYEGERGRYSIFEVVRIRR